MKRQETVFVRNNGTETYKDRYDGEDFEIPPGQSVEMLIECAQLCLAFGEDDKSRALRRKGWSATHDGIKSGAEKLAKFSFHMSEREATEHGQEKRKIKDATSHSSAPVVGGAAGVGSETTPPAPAVQAEGRKLGPLEKLAAANLAAG